MLKTASILIIIWLAVLLVTSLLTYSFFWYETANSKYLAHLEQLSKGRTKQLVLKGIISSFWSMICVTLFFALGFWHKLWESEPDPACPLPPIILIHGLYHNPSAWTLYRWRLRRGGFKNVYALAYGSWGHSFDELLEKLSERIGEIADLFSGKPPVLIGHSLGGLLVRAYVESRENSKDVAAIITLGAPHQGSKLAVLGIGKLAKSLKYRGSLIEKLEDHSKTSPISRLAVYSPVDNMVLPAEALQVPRQDWSHYESLPTSHVAMLFSPRLFRWLDAYLLKLCQSNSGGRNPDECL